MRKLVAGFALLALILAAAIGGFARPASAEFFGCNDQHRGLSSSARDYSAPARRQYAGHYTHEVAARSSRRPERTNRTYPDRLR